MALAVNNSQYTFYPSNQPSSVNYTVNGSSTLLLVLISMSGTYVTGATWDGVSMSDTGLGTPTQNPTGQACQSFFLKNPHTGAKTLSLTWNGGGSSIVSVSLIDLSGNDTTTPIDTYNSATYTYPGVATISTTLVTRQDGEIIVGIGEGTSGYATDFTSTGGTLVGQGGNNSNHNSAVAYKTATTAGSNSFSFTTVNTDGLLIAGIAIAPPTVAPTITSFTASPTPIYSGSNSTLSWTDTVGTPPATFSIDNGVGSVSSNSSVSVSPTVTTTYTLTATNIGGTATSTATVTVYVLNKGNFLPFF